METTRKVLKAVKLRRGFKNHEKLMIISYAKENGRLKAADHFNIDEKNIRNWRKRELELTDADPMRISKRGRKCFHEELEKELVIWIHERRKKKIRVTGKQIQLEAKCRATVSGIIGFQASCGWLGNFKARNKLSTRCRTSVGQNLPADYLEKLQSFRDYVHVNKEGVQLKDLINMDEMPMAFDMAGNWTVDDVGTKEIHIATTGAEKSNFTVVLGVSADGGKLPPMVIFKRLTMPKVNFPKGIIVQVNKKGWMNQQVMQIWMDQCWKARPMAMFAKKKNCLLVYDACRAHITPDVKVAVSKYTKLAVIPGGLTKLAQPLDISVNKPMKDRLREQWDKWMEDEAQISLTKGGNRRKADYVTVCEWILAAWKDINPASIKNGFLKAGIHTYEEEIMSTESDPIVHVDIGLENILLNDSDDEAEDIGGGGDASFGEDFDGFDDD